MLALVNGVFVSTKKKKTFQTLPVSVANMLKEKPSKKWPARAKPGCFASEISCSMILHPCFILWDLHGNLEGKI